MNQAELYQHSNQVQRADAECILKEYANVLRWRHDGFDSLLDVGCGCGDVLIDFIYPLLPLTFERITGVDCSTSMVRFASNRYKDYKKLNFGLLDISAEKLPEEFYEQYDHITSFYCLHWVVNQKKALENIYKTLRREGGDCLLVFLCTNFVFNVYEILGKQKKWSAYMTDVPKFLAPQHHSADPMAEFHQLMAEANFVDINVEIREESFTYIGEENFRNNVRAVCPFLEWIPKKQHEEFLDDFTAVVDSFNLRQVADNPDETKIISPYKLIVAYGRKEGTFAKSIVPYKIYEKQHIM